jgi:hypothetical protein
LHVVLSEGRSQASAAERAGVARQTVGNWLTQLKCCLAAHLSEHLPRLGFKASPASPAASPLVPGRPPLANLWFAMLAAAGIGSGGAPGVIPARQALESLQPMLSKLRPAAGVFRVPLHNPARAPPYC